MIGYSERLIFTEGELELWRRARILVAAVDLRLLILDGQELRCHELARVVGRILTLPITDGKYGHVEHSWLTIAPTARGGCGCILDVYSPGQVPQVQLLDTFVGLGHRELYKPGVIRDDIREVIVDAVEIDVRQRVPVW
jgi:hypothetical protein